MRVCFVVPGFSSDPDDWCIPVVRTVIEALADRVEATVVTPHYPFRKSVYSIGRITVHCLSDSKQSGAKRLLLWAETIRRIVAEGRERRFTAIHAFWGTETGWLATVAARRLGVPSIVSLAGGEMARLARQNYGSQLRMSGRLMVARSLACADYLTAGSSWMIQLLPQPHRARTLRVPLGVDTGRFGPGPVRTGSRLLAVSSLYPWKDLHTTIEAFARIAAADNSVVLDIVGSGIEREKLGRLASALGVAHKVAFHGEVNHGSMPDFYRRADVLIHAGLYEAQCMAIVEALATGLPVVASRVGVAADLDGDLVTTFAPGDVENLARALTKTLADRAAAERIAIEGPNRIVRDYSLHKTVDDFLSLYQQIERGRA